MAICANKGSGFANLLLTVCRVLWYKSNMARKPRVECTGALYHVIVRGNQRQKVFLADDDHRQYIERLKFYQKRHAFALYAYVLMPNHVHLLIEQGETPLSKAMQGIQQSYTNYYNRKYGKSGHLFQGRYKAILCDRDAYLLELIRYIHLNPVRAGMVEQPHKYPWSSHHSYLSGKASDILSINLPLSLLRQDGRISISEYRKFIADGIKDGYREELYMAKDQRYLGTDDFVAEVETKKDYIEKGKQFTVMLAIDDVVREVAREFKVSVEMIVEKSRVREGAKLRAIAAHLASEVGGFQLSEAAMYFGRDPATISIAVSKLRSQKIKDLILQKRLSAIEERLRKGRKVKYQISKV